MNLLSYVISYNPPTRKKALWVRPFDIGFGLYIWYNEKWQLLRLIHNADTAKITDDYAVETYSKDETNTKLEDYAKTAIYDSLTHKIYLKNGNITLSTIDCADFIKDGMLDSVETKTVDNVKYLVFTFNLESGKDTITIPLSDFFPELNYYTKSEIDIMIGDIETLLAAI